MEMKTEDGKDGVGISFPPSYDRPKPDYRNRVFPTEMMK